VKHRKRCAPKTTRAQRLKTAKAPFSTGISRGIFIAGAEDGHTPYFEPGIFFTKKLLADGGGFCIVAFRNLN
jgi:hypothetical protein